MKAARARWFAANGLGTWSLCNNCRHHRLDKHAVARGAIKVPDSLNAAIILSSLVLEFNANPLPNLEVGLAGKSNRSLATVAQLDYLARLKVRHYE